MLGQGVNRGESEAAFPVHESTEARFLQTRGPGDFRAQLRRASDATQKRFGGFSHARQSARRLVICQAMADVW